MCQKCQRITRFNKHHNEYTQIENLSSLFDTASPDLKGDHQQISSTSSEHLFLAKTVGMIQAKMYVEIGHLFEKQGGTIIILDGND